MGLQSQNLWDLNYIYREGNISFRMDKLQLRVYRVELIFFYFTELSE